MNTLRILFASVFLFAVGIPQSKADSLSSENYTSKYSLFTLQFSNITPKICNTGFGTITVGLIAKIKVIYPSNIQVISIEKQANECRVVFKDADGIQQTVAFAYEDAPMPSALAHKYRLQQNYHVWPQDPNTVLWQKDTDTPLAAN